MVNDTIAPDDIMGNPLDALTPLLEPIQWLTGSALGMFIVAVILGILIAAVIASLGAGMNKAEMKSKGMNNIVFMGVIVITVVFILMLVWYLFNRFLL